jgi:hypothetical protein
MNKLQIRAARQFTNQVQRVCDLDGAFTFQIDRRLANGEIVLSASNNNSDTPWFKASVFVIAIIGPRGKFSVAHSSGVPASAVTI